MSHHWQHALPSPRGRLASCGLDSGRICCCYVERALVFLQRKARSRASPLGVPMEWRRENRCRLEAPVSLSPARTFFETHRLCRLSRRAVALRFQSVRNRSCPDHRIGLGRTTGQVKRPALSIRYAAAQPPSLVCLFCSSYS